MFARRTAVVTALAALIFAGCGGSSALSKDEYTKKINATGKSLSQSFTDLGPAMTNAKDTSKLSATLESGAKALRDQAKQLDGITPPEEVKQANKDLVAGLNAMGDSFDQAAKAAKSGTLTAILPKLQAITTSKGVDLVRKAITAIKAKGYKIDSNTG